MKSSELTLSKFKHQIVPDPQTNYEKHLFLKICTRDVKYGSLNHKKLSEKSLQCNMWLSYSTELFSIILKTHLCISWYKFQNFVKIIEVWLLHSQPFPLSHYCETGNLPSVAAAAQTNYVIRYDPSAQQCNPTQHMLDTSTVAAFSGTSTLLFRPLKQYFIHQFNNNEEVTNTVYEWLCRQQ
jgi:hypothetical protein